MTDTVKSWIEERRDFHRKRWVERDSWAEAARDWQANFPRTLNALEQVLEQVERMEIDAKTYGIAGHDYASESLAAYAGAIRQAIEGAINE